jgi:hypothetical protein
MEDNKLREELIARFSQMPGAKASGSYISGLTCKQCGHKEAYVLLYKPFYTLCNRKNKCGQMTKYLEYFSDLHRVGAQHAKAWWETKRFFSEEDKKPTYTSFSGPQKILESQLTSGCIGENYLNRRGISLETAKKYGIGFLAPKPAVVRIPL